MNVFHYGEINVGCKTQVHFLVNAVFQQVKMRQMEQVKHGVNRQSQDREKKTVHLK